MTPPTLAKERHISRVRRSSRKSAEKPQLSLFDGDFYMPLRSNIEDINTTAAAYITSRDLTKGTSIALKVPKGSPISAISRKPPQTLDDLSQLAEASVKQWPMLRTTIGLICNWRNSPPDQIPLNDLADARSDFEAFLATRKYRRGSIRSYLNYFRILVNLATTHGWTAADSAIAALWEPIIAASPKKPRFTNIFKFACSHGIAPEQFGEPELESWAEWAISRGNCCESYSRGLRSSFRFFIFRNGFRTLLRNPHRPGGTRYRVPFEKLPEPLRSQTEELIRWKLADYADDRPLKYKHRPVTANELRALICRMYGVAKNLKGRSLSSLLELVSRPVVTEFASWYINERRNLGGSLNSQMSMLLTSASRFVLFAGTDLAWTRKFLETLPQVDEDRQQRRKLSKWVKFEEVKSIPSALRNARTQPGIKPKIAATLARDELLMKFLTVLPWRQRNLREARISGEHPNIFKGMAPSVGISRPKWIEEEVKQNPDAKFWQFHFDKDETKAGRPVSGYIPRVLIPILEEYFAVRHRLIRQPDPGTLFVGTTGKPISEGRLHAIVVNVARKYVYRAVNPHLFRDIFAIAWLEAQPEDYLTLSKILWHKDVKVTLQRYGRNFDESHAARRVDEWLGEAQP